MQNSNEALKFLEKYDYSNSAQVLIADAQGNSVIINAGTKVLKTGNYQINTNFDISKVKTGDYSCRRYDISQDALKDVKTLDVPFFRDMLSLTRQEGKLSTIYSNIYDLKRGIIYVYNFHDFNKPYIIDLKKELTKGYRLDKISNHFPMSFAYESFLKLDPAMYHKEMILDEIDNKGLNVTLDRYINNRKDTLIKDNKMHSVLLEVGIQLVKDAYNRHAGGGLWEYWFSLPGGFKNEYFKDQRLAGAARILEFLKEQRDTDQKTKNFIYELLAYVNMLEQNKDVAMNYYQQASADSENTWPVSYNRSQKMLTLLAGK